MVSGFLANLERVGENISDLEREQLGEAGIDLLSSTLRWVSRPADCHPVGAQPSSTSIKQYVRTRLDDPALDPGSVAAAFAISVRHVHRLFSDEAESFSSWVRNERLTRCFDRLGDPGYRDVGIHDIRERYGFTDAAVFSRAFKRRYGITPSARREQISDPP